MEKYSFFFVCDKGDGKLPFKSESQEVPPLMSTREIGPKVSSEFLQEWWLLG